MNRKDRVLATDLAIACGYPTTEGFLDSMTAEEWRQLRDDARRRWPFTLDDDGVTLYAGQDYSDAIHTLIRLSGSEDRYNGQPTGHFIPEIRYSADTDWLAEAHHLATATGWRLHRIGRAWTLGPRECCCVCTCT